MYRSSTLLAFIICREMECIDKLGCAVLLAEAILDERRPHPSRAFLQSLNMLVQTQGKERNLLQYRDLMQMHGFADVHVCHTGNFLDAILAIKV